MSKTNATPETILKREIVAWLEASRIDTWPVAIGPVVTGRGRAPNPMRGHPDRAGLLRGGHYFAIEVKAPGWRGKLDEYQAAWRKRLEDGGAIYVLATSLDDVRSALAKFFLTSRNV